MHAHAHVRTYNKLNKVSFEKSPMPRTATPAPATGRRIQIRRSGVHGKGVFAVQPIAEGEVLIEYTGEVIGWEEAQDRHPHDPTAPQPHLLFSCGR